ncbi:MAG: quercetin 2,3-dioxygenase, partial [Gammaproteobacteria bacterium]|nr:quercetin 2,3-dioxygenase [Gammaproteobacteria bacterium]
LVSPDGREDSIASSQDGLMFGSLLAPGESLDYLFDADRQGYLHLARGRLRAGDANLNQGDSLAIQYQTRLELEGIEDAEFLLFDLS